MEDQRAALDGLTPDQLDSPSDALHDLFEAAEQMHDLFESFMVGGFTEDQALKLCANVMVANAKGVTG